MEQNWQTHHLKSFTTLRTFVGRADVTVAMASLSLVFIYIDSRQLASMM